VAHQEGDDPHFTFARVRYQSGNWDADPKMPPNILNSLSQYFGHFLSERD
jgi:hypothetical protein